MQSLNVKVIQLSASAIWIIIAVCEIVRLQMQVMDLELEILDVWEKDGVSCERVRNRCRALHV